MRIRDRLKGAFKRMAADTGMGKLYKDVFDVEGVPAFRQFYDLQIFPAKYVYRGFFNAWHTISATTINNPSATRTIFRTNFAKAICAELAQLCLAENPVVHVSVGGQPGDDNALQDFVYRVLDENNFWKKMVELCEQSNALGGAAIKEYIKARKDEKGFVIPESIKIVLDYCMADQFVPTSWTNADVTEAVFVSRKAKDGYYFTRLEWHKWDGDTYVISNDAYRSDIRTDGQNILGYSYPLVDIEPDLEPVVEIENLSRSLFSYFRTPIANNVDDNSPLGISMYANAMDTLHALDICYDSLVQEFRLGKKRIIVPASALRTVVDPSSGRMLRYFDTNDEVYQAFATDDMDNLKIQDNSVELRVGEHVDALNALLSVLCLQVGFSAGTFSFDLHSGIKTATEIISQNSKTYKTIRAYQDEIATAIKGVVESVISLGALYGMSHDGKSIASLVSRGYEVSISMPDAVLEDDGSKINRGISLVGNGLMSKLTFMTTYLGLTDEEAKSELEKISKESTGTVDTIDRLDIGGWE